MSKYDRDKSGAAISKDNTGLAAFKAARERAKRLDRLEGEVARLNILVTAMAKKLGIEIE